MYPDCNERFLLNDIDLISQEFRRIFIPFQPKTRRATLDSDPDAQGIASKEIKDFEQLYYDDFKENMAAIKADKWEGLGLHSVFDLLFDEQDFVPRNFVLVGNKMVKLDGDCCFFPVRNWKTTKVTTITAEDIATLPNAAHSKYNWLYQWNKRKEYTNLLVKCTKKCREEINQALLSALILPPEFIRHFVNYYAQAQNIFRLTDFLLTRMN